MTEYIVIGAVILSLIVSYALTARTVKRVSLLLARTTREVVGIVEDIRQANQELSELRKSLQSETHQADRSTEDRSSYGRRNRDRRKGDRRQPSEQRDQNSPEHNNSSE